MSSLDAPQGRHIFHLSIPVADLATSKHFYVDAFDARVGRETQEWLDVLVWGHQITLQLRPGEVVSLEQQGKRHFGVTLPWDEWERCAERIKFRGIEFLSQPTLQQKGTAQEQAKFYLVDPSNNVIEIKAYRDVGGTLGLREE